MNDVWMDCVVEINFDQNLIYWMKFFVQILFFSQNVLIVLIIIGHKQEVVHCHLTTRASR